jgi:hypothetical protein
MIRKTALNFLKVGSFVIIVIDCYLQIIVFYTFVTFHVYFIFILIAKRIPISKLKRYISERSSSGESVGNTKIVVQNRDKWLNIDQASSNNNARQKLGGGTTGGSMNCSDSDAMKKGKFLNSNSNPRGPSSSSVWMGEFTIIIWIQFVGGGQKYHPDNYVF